MFFRYLNKSNKIIKMPAIAIAQVTHCIFDMDGLLLGKFNINFLVVFFLPHFINAEFFFHLHRHRAHLREYGQRYPENVWQTVSD